MRFTGADTLNDTGCWQAAAFDNARSFRAVGLTDVPPIVVRVSRRHERQPSLYSELFAIPRPDLNELPVDWRPTTGLSAADCPVSQRARGGSIVNNRWFYYKSAPAS